ncbi:hypothetical protein GWI33_004927 [Rhynchophorus ferrugineus]|uniref:Uncharacterized protein n=1 Tax=Rhynchophorus ferrugineus TaxID=354439 RepID=A0A834IUY0_RHYFE|nr:hypothetical protein GWI33_004927 [Rhynchophorus ferrugineus]
MSPQSCNTALLVQQANKVLSSQPSHLQSHHAAAAAALSSPFTSLLGSSGAANQRLKKSEDKIDVKICWFADLHIWNVKKLSCRPLHYSSTEFFGPDVLVTTGTRGYNNTENIPEDLVGFPKFGGLI